MGVRCGRHAGYWAETDFLEEVEVGKSRRNLAVSKWIWLVWHLGSELPSCVFIEQFMSDGK